MDKLEKLRSVGNLEKYSTSRHPLGFYLNVAMSGTYTLPESFAFPLKDYVYKAVETLINQHPILSAIPVDEETEEPYFARLPEIDLDKAISFEQRSQGLPHPDEPDSELETLLHAQHNTAFSAPLPYWRLCILTNNADNHQFTAVFVYHHAIGDGGSGKAFHRTFLEAIRAAASLEPEQAKQTVKSPQTPLLPNLEAIHSLPISLGYLIPLLFKEKVWSRKDPKLWAGGSIRTPMKTQLRHLVLSAHQTSTLVKCCRENGTTVTCAIQTAIACAIFKHVPDQYTHLVCSGAMSSRKWLPDTITDDVMGVWVQEFAENYTRKNLAKDSFPWGEAKRSRKTIEKELTLKGKNTTVGLFKYVGNYRDDLLLAKIGKARRVSYEVSSLGVVKTDNTQDPSLPQMGRMVFSQSASVAGPAFEVSVITGADGCLVLGISWQTDVVEEKTMLAVIETLSAELSQLCT